MSLWRVVPAVAALLIAVSAPAQRPSIDVAFTIAQPQFDIYDAADLRMIQIYVGDGLALKMNGPDNPPLNNVDHGAFPLFDFRSQPAAHHLTIEVADGALAFGIAPEVVLNLRIDNVNPPLVVPFKPAGGARDEPAGDAKAFAASVVKALSTYVDFHRQDWVDALFKEIVLAENIPADQGQNAFKMPYPAEQYEIGYESVFRVITPDGLVNLKPKPFSSPMLLPVDSPPPLVQKVRNGGTVTPNLVQVLTYAQSRQATKQKPPSSAVPSGK